MILDLRLCRAVWIGLVMACLWFCAPNLGFSQSTDTNRQFLVLKNYQAMGGTIRQTARGFELTVGRTTSVFHPSRVWFKARSLSEAYWRMIARIKASDVKAQVQVFQFCMRYKLFSEAENQLDILQLLPIKATELEQLHKQVSFARKRARSIREQSTQMTRQQLANSFQEPTRAAPIIRPLPPMERPQSQTGLTKSAPALQSNSVAQVNFDEPIETRNVPSARELDELTDSLPKNAVAIFKRKIEPLMTRSCYAAKCHDSKSSMPVMRLSEMRVMPRRMSQRNMHSVLKFADAYAPLESELLRKASSAHGGAKEPPLKPRSDQFNRLAQWLISVSNEPMKLHKMPEWMLTKQEIAALESQAEWEALQLEKLAKESLPEEEEELDFDPEEFAGLPAALRLTDDLESGVNSKKTPASPAEPEIKKESGDPFDPNVFNSKFGKSKSTGDKK